MTIEQYTGWMPVCDGCGERDAFDPDEGTWQVFDEQGQAVEHVKHMAGEIEGERVYCETCWEENNNAD